MNPRPAEIGDLIADIESLALIVDLGALNRNIARMAKSAHSAGARARPHAKTRKLAAMAPRQIARGTVGQCAQEVGEAEGLVRGVNTFRAWRAWLMRQREPTADASCEIVAWAATGTLAFEAKGVKCNELQVGSYIFSDPDYGKIGSEDGGRYIASEHCLFVRTSDPTVAAAGLKLCGGECGPRRADGVKNAELTGNSGERGKLTRGPTARNGLALGEMCGSFRIIVIRPSTCTSAVRREKRPRLGILPVTAPPAGIGSMDI